MIKVIEGDVLAVKSGFIVHGCNCQGVMGAGVALAVKNKFPAAYNAYKTQQATEGLHLGDISFCEVEPGTYIINALTQHLDVGYSNGRLTSYDAVTECFEKVKFLARRLGVTQISFPLIGAVRGGGDWEIIKKIIEQVIPDTFSKTLYIFNP